MTAVEWLEENLKMILPQSQYNDVIIQNIIKQAKEIEKQQIIDAFSEGYFDEKSAEQYYNETFKNK